MEVENKVTALNGCRE